EHDGFHRSPLREFVWPRGMMTSPSANVHPKTSAPRRGPPAAARSLAAPCARWAWARSRAKSRHGSGCAARAMSVKSQRDEGAGDDVVRPQPRREIASRGGDAQVRERQPILEKYARRPGQAPLHADLCLRRDAAEPLV